MPREEALLNSRNRASYLQSELGGVSLKQATNGMPKLDGASIARGVSCDKADAASSVNPADEGHVH